MRNYQHKHDATRQVYASQLSARNADDLADWCGGRVLDGSTAAVEVPTQGGASSVVAVEGDYLVADDNAEFFVRSSQIFEAKYELSDNQDDEIDFELPDADEGQDDAHGHRFNESDWSENASGETESEDRRQ